MKILICSFLFFSQTQIDTIPNLDSLNHSIETYYNQKSSSEIAEFQRTEKLSFLKYLPIPSIVNWDGKPRLQFSFSVSQIYSFANDKETREQKINSIIKQNDLLCEVDKMKLMKLSREALLILELIDFEKQMFETKKQIFEIQKMKFENKEILLTEFLKLKLIYEESLFDIKLKENECKRKLLEMYELAKIKPF